MKKNLFLMSVIALAMLVQGCSKGGDDEGGEGSKPPVENPDKDAISTQFTNKTVSLPALNFPAVDVTTTEFTLEEGSFQAKLNGTQFNADKFATGVVLPEEGVITIEQGGTVLVSFSPKTGGAGTKIKITGIGSTSALAAAAGLGQGVYTWKLAKGAEDMDGYLKGYSVYAGGNKTNLITEIQLLGGVAYKVRRDHQNGSDAVDVEGWAVAPADLGNGFDADASQAISVYLSADASKPVAQQVPILSATPFASSGMIPFVIQRLVKEEGAGSDYYVQGNGDITTMFKIGDGVKDNYDFASEGIPADHVNQSPYARAFYPQIEFKLYVVANKADTTTTANLASDDICNAFVSNEGIDPEDKFVIMKVVNPERVNTLEALSFIYKRKASPENAKSMIRFEGLAYDAQRKVFVLTSGMTVRSSPY